ncbi:LacI family transcriptional regulator [Arthrobacter sp. CAN_A214]
MASLAGVSIATVSFAFRQPERVRESTRDAIIRAADVLGYVPSGSARGLARGRTGALGLFSFDYLAEPADRRKPLTALNDDEESLRFDLNEEFRLFPLYVDEVQRGFELECWHRGLALMIGGGNRSSSEAVVADIAGRVDGLAVFPRTVPEETLRRISRRIPVVELSEPSQNGSVVNHVTVQNAEGMRLLTEHLIATHGYRNLHFIGALVTSDSEARFEGFSAALKAANLPAPQRPTVSSENPDHIVWLISDLLNSGSLPQGFVCATDPEALDVIDALSDMGVDVPSRVAVTGFDGIAAGRIVKPSLTTVRQPMERMGREAVSILLERLGDADKPRVNRQLPVQLVLRESCGCSIRRPSQAPA